MRSPTRIPTVLTLGAVVLVAGCGGGSSAPQKQSGGSSSSSAQAQQAATQKRLQQAAAVPAKVKHAAAKKATKLPASNVATVAGKPITLAAFRRAYRAQLQSFPGGAPQPPPFTRCVAALDAQFAAMAKRAAKARSGKAPHKPAAAELRKQCKSRLASARQGAMTQLITASWTAQEAKARHIAVSAHEVDATLARQRTAYQSDAKWRAYLRQTHQTEAVLRARIRQSLLNQKLMQARLGPAPHVTDAEVTRYFNEHRAQFGLPERRNIDVIEAKSQAAAKAAKRAVEHGMSWSAAVKKWSIDPVTKASDGQLLGVVHGSREPALDTLAFSARRGALAGPAKGQKGWYLARVTKVIKGTKPSIGPYKARIRMLLEQQQRAQHAAAANAAYQGRWRARTVCKPGYVVPLCANAKPTS